MAARLLEKTEASFSCSILCPVYLKRRVSANICFQVCLSLINLDFWVKFFLLGNAEFTKRPILREYTGVVNNPSSETFSYTK